MNSQIEPHIEKNDWNNIIFLEHQKCTIYLGVTGYPSVAQKLKITNIFGVEKGLQILENTGNRDGSALIVSVGDSVVWFLL